MILNNKNKCDRYHGDNFSLFAPEEDYEAIAILRGRSRERSIEVGIQHRSGGKEIVLSHVYHKKNGSTRRGHFIHLKPGLFPALAEFMEVAPLAWKGDFGEQTYVGTAFSGCKDDAGLYDKACVRVFVFKHAECIVRLEGECEDSFCLDACDVINVLQEVSKALKVMKQVSPSFLDRNF